MIPTDSREGNLEHREREQHPVIDLIRNRARAGSKPGLRVDSARLALAFEGGAMRGITSAGMGLALVQLGLADVFDVVYGSSAGALNSAYFVSGQGQLGFSVYYEDINNSRFISRRRLFAGRIAVALDYLFDHVMTDIKPLDFAAIADSPISLRVVASNLDERKAVAFGPFRSKADLFNKLKASAAMPFLAGPPVAIDGQLYSDASLYESIPFRSAIAGDSSERCSHVLVLRSRPKGMLSSSPSFMERQLLGRALRAHGGQLYEDFLDRPRRYAQDAAELERRSETGDGPPYILEVAVPEAAEPLDQLERDRTKLIASASAGMSAIVNRLLGTDPRVVQTIYPLSMGGRMLKLS